MVIRIKRNQSLYILHKDCPPGWAKLLWENPGGDRLEHCVPSEFVEDYERIGWVQIDNYGVAEMNKQQLIETLQKIKVAIESYFSGQNSARWVIVEIQKFFIEVVGVTIPEADATAIDRIDVVLLDERQQATVLAALRLWQEHREGNIVQVPLETLWAVEEIATGNGEFGEIPDAQEVSELADAIGNAAAIELTYIEL
ncbi:MAG TPA: hypothetical protein V6C65_23615 [Allocoleopsis sp.]